ncbi:MAG: hypothetical protein ACOYEV_13575 [Candidatus Nanopelagicales bacterium]
MYIDDLVAVARRRWPILFVGVLLSLGLAAAVFRFVAPIYQLQSSVLLVPPATADVPNPFFSLGSLSTATDVVARAMASEPVLTRVVAEGGGESYTVERDQRVSSPILLVTAEAASPDLALLTMHRVLVEIPIVIATAQKSEGVPAKSKFTSAVIAEQSVPDVRRKPQIQLALVVLPLGLSVTAALMTLADSRSRRGRAGMGQRGAAEDEPDVPVD